MTAPRGAGQTRPVNLSLDLIKTGHLAIPSYRITLLAPAMASARRSRRVCVSRGCWMR